LKKLFKTTINPEGVKDVDIDDPKMQITSSNRINNKKSFYI